MLIAPPPEYAARNHESSWGSYDPNSSESREEWEKHSPGALISVHAYPHDPDDPDEVGIVHLYASKSGITAMTTDAAEAFALAVIEAAKIARGLA